MAETEVIADILIVFFRWTSKWSSWLLWILCVFIKMFESHYNSIIDFGRIGLLVKILF